MLKPLREESINGLTATDGTAWWKRCVTACLLHRMVSSVVVKSFKIKNDVLMVSVCEMPNASSYSA